MRGVTHLHKPMQQDCLDVQDVSKTVRPVHFPLSQQKPPQLGPMTKATWRDLCQRTCDLEMMRSRFRALSSTGISTSNRPMRSTSQAPWWCRTICSSDMKLAGKRFARRKARENEVLFFAGSGVLRDPSPFSERLTYLRSEK